MHDLTIADIDIRQDEHGRYCLNDLHVASGGDQRHRPNYFLGNKQTRALIAELENRAGIPAQRIAGIPAISTTQKIGTFVVKQLVYAYAMWISPAFNLKVIDAYDALVTGEIGQINRRVALNERAYFERYPSRRTIRALALKGEPYWYIAQCVRCTPAEVGKSAAAITRTCAWLQQRGVQILGYGWHFFGGARVRAQDGHALRKLLAEQRVSRGHTVSDGVRVEHWQARDPRTQVLVEWDEERTGGSA